MQKQEKQKTIAELEKEYDKTRNSYGDTVPYDVQDKLVQLRKELYGRKVAAKKLAADLEAKNNQYLIMIASGKTIYKMIGHSAVFFHQIISKRIKENSNLISDNDKYAKSRYGVVSKKLTESFEEKLRKADIVRTDELKLKVKNDDVVVFKLPEPFTDEQVEVLIDQVRAEEVEFLKFVTPKNPLPNLYLAICESVSIAFDMPAKVKNSDEVTKILIEPIIEKTTDIAQQYLDMAMGRTGRMDALLAMKHRIIEVKNLLAILDVVPRFREKHIVYRLGEKIHEAEKTIARLLKQNKVPRDKYSNELQGQTA